MTTPNLQDPSTVPIVGRESEQGKLIDALRAARTGKRTTWLVRGPVGIGKTRLLDWLEGEAGKEGFRVKRGSGLKGVVTPFGVFQQVFRGSPMGSLASSGEPTMTVMLHYLAILERESASTPLVVLVDDLQSTDADSARLFQFLARNTKGLRVVLVGAVETEGDLPAVEGTGATLPDVLQSMASEGLVSNLLVGGLGREGIRQLAENFGGARFVPSPLFENLLDVFERAGGNPYHVLATVRGLAECSQLNLYREGLKLEGFRSDGGGVGKLALPADARAAVEGRIRLLTDDQRRLIQCAAVLGPEFRIESVAAVLDKDPSDAVRLSTGLTAEHRFLRPPSTREGVWSFTHPLTWHVVLDSQSQQERTAWASTLATWWATHRPEEVEPIARLYYLANDNAEGPIWATKALNAALELGSPEWVERAFRWLQELSTDKPTRERVDKGIKVYDRLVQSAGISPVALRMLKSLMDIGNASAETRIEIESRLAVALCQLNGPAAAKETLSNLSRHLTRVGTHATMGTRARLAVAKGVVDYYEGRYKQAALALKSADALSLKADLVNVRCYALYLLGLSLLTEDRIHEASRVSAKLTSAANRLRSFEPRVQQYGLGLAAAVAERQGAVSESIRAFELVQVFAWENGNVNNATISLANLAAAYSEARLFEDALETAREAETLANRFGLSQGLALARSAIGEALVGLGSHEEGRALLLRAAAYFSETHWPLKRLECQLAVVKSKLLEGQAKLSFEILETLVPDLGLLTPRPKILFHVYRAAAFRQLDDSTKANAELGKARTLSEASGDLLGRAQVTAERARLERVSGWPVDSDKSWGEAQALFARCGVTAPVPRDDLSPASEVAPSPQPTVNSSAAPIKSGTRNRLNLASAVRTNHHAAPSEFSTSGTDVVQAAPLSLSQKVVALIAKQSRLREDELAPPSITQTGISMVLNRPQGVVAKVLHRLEAAGLARFEVRHVRGGSRRVKVYQLTPQGEALARELAPSPTGAAGLGTH